MLTDFKWFSAAESASRFNEISTRLSRDYSRLFNSSQPLGAPRFVDIKFHLLCIIDELYTHARAVISIAIKQRSDTLELLCKTNPSIEMCRTKLCSWSSIWSVNSEKGQHRASFKRDK